MSVRRRVQSVSAIVYLKIIITETVDMLKKCGDEFSTIL